jgi:hypothetical protein
MYCENNCPGATIPVGSRNRKPDASKDYSSFWRESSVDGMTFSIRIQPAQSEERGDQWRGRYQTGSIDFKA